MTAVAVAPTATPRLRRGRPQPCRKYVPCGPLLPHMEMFVRAEGLQAFSAYTGISARLLYAWRSGERNRVTWDAADAVFVAFDVFWWEVFDPADARPCVTFSGVRGRDVVAWVRAAEMAADLWDGGAGVGDRVKLAQQTWTVESWDERIGCFWLRKLRGGRRQAFSPDRLDGGA